jgi:hypothetical protein
VTVQDAAKAVEDSGARLVAGGTDLWPNMKRRHQKAETVVSLMSIPELDAIDSSGNPPALAGIRHCGGVNFLTTTAKHGYDRWQSLHRHSLHLLQPNGRMAALDRLLPERRGHDLLGGDKVATLLGAYCQRFGTNALCAGR